MVFCSRRPEKTNATFPLHTNPAPCSASPVVTHQPPLTSLRGYVTYWISGLAPILETFQSSAGEGHMRGLRNSALQPNASGLSVQRLLSFGLFASFILIYLLFIGIR